MQRTLKPVKDPGATGNPAEKFSACLVWTPIPLITWLLPFVGHMVRLKKPLGVQGILCKEGTLLELREPHLQSRASARQGARSSTLLGPTPSPQATLHLETQRGAGMILILHLPRWQATCMHCGLGISTGTSGWTHQKQRWPAAATSMRSRSSS